MFLLGSYFPATALATSAVPTDAKPDGLYRFDTFGLIEVEDGTRIIDYPLLSVSQGDITAFRLAMSYNAKNVEILGVSAPLPETGLTYDIADGTLRFKWQRSAPALVNQGDTLAILRLYLKHKPVNRIDRYFRLDPAGFEVTRNDRTKENWQIALPEVALYYYEMPDETAYGEPDMADAVPDSRFSHRETTLRQQGGEANSIEILSVIPNPMKSWADITYSVTGDCIVNLKLYTLLGEEVATLVNGKRTSGLYRHNITPPGFTSGIYLLRLSTVHHNIVESDIMKVVVHNN